MALNSKSISSANNELTPLSADVSTHKATLSSMGAVLLYSIPLSPHFSANSLKAPSTLLDSKLLFKSIMEVSIAFWSTTHSPFEFFIFIAKSNTSFDFIYKF